MTEALLALIPLILFILKRVWSKERIEKKKEKEKETERHERDKELVEQDSPAISLRLHDRAERLRLHLEKKGKHPRTP